MARLTRKRSRLWAAVAGVVLAAATCGVAIATAPTPAPTSAAKGVTTTVVAGPRAAGGDPSKATCPDGTHLIGGGYDLGAVFVDVQSGVPASFVSLDAPSASDRNTWVVRATNDGAQAFALCETNA